MYSQSRYILCVDDDIDDYTVVFETIKIIDPSMNIVEARDGEEALNYLNKAKTFNILPCLVILDINMPRMDGKQTLVHIKEDAGLKDVPVVVLSTSDTQRDRMFCSYYGVDFYTKPNKTAEYRSVIDQLMKYCGANVVGP